MSRAALLLLCIPLFFIACASEPPELGPGPFGVFIGLDSEDQDKLLDYRTVVIDAQYYTLDDIIFLHSKGIMVYSYLNIGSLEQFRDYYDEFADLTMDAYEGWENEKWLDVSSPVWQNFLVTTLARSLEAKAIDGFFVDNADVYYRYPTESVYRAVLEILRNLNEYNLPVIINGGDVFVTKALEQDLADTPVKGINQESVFTRPLGNGHFGVQDNETSAYYRDYLDRCKAAGLRVYLTEYLSADNISLKGNIKNYCRGKGFTVYFAPSQDLN